MCNPDTCRKVGKKNKKLQICKVLCYTHTTGMNNRCGDGSDRDAHQGCIVVEGEPCSGLSCLLSGPHSIEKIFEKTQKIVFSFA